MQAGITKAATDMRGAPCDAQDGESVPAENEAVTLVARSVNSGFCTPCESAVAITGWATLLMNLVNVVVTIVACCRLNAYLNAPHPGDDSYNLAGLAYLFLLPSLIDSVLMLLFAAYILYGEYCRVTSRADDRESVVSSAKCLLHVIVCAILFIISCWPAGGALYVLYQEVSDTDIFSQSLSNCLVTVCILVSVSFAMFAIVLCMRTGRGHCS